MAAQGAPLLGGPTGHMSQPHTSPALETCLHHPWPFPKATLLVNPKHTLHLLPYLSEAYDTPGHLPTLKRSSLGFPDTPRPPGCLLPLWSRGPDTCEVSSSTTGPIHNNGVTSHLCHILSLGNHCHSSSFQVHPKKPQMLGRSTMIRDSESICLK